MVRSAFSLVELLLVVAVVTILMALALPSLSSGRNRARDVHCTSKLHEIGALILQFAVEHDDCPAPVIRERDYRWSAGGILGWDIAIGRWGRIDGGRETIWSCSKNGASYVGNSRALGLDDRPAFPEGRLYRVKFTRWYEPSRLILAYDVQADLLGSLMAHAADPDMGDLSDEMDGRWPRDSGAPTIPAYLGDGGPHVQGGFGALFGDGHGVVQSFTIQTTSVLWSGPRWW